MRATQRLIQKTKGGGVLFWGRLGTIEMLWHKASPPRGVRTIHQVIKWMCEVEAEACVAIRTGQRGDGGRS